MSKSQYGKAYVKAQDGVTRLTVTLFLSQSLPIYSIGGETVGTYESSMKTVSVTRPVASEPNLLIGMDADGNEVPAQFKPIAVIVSMTTNNEAIVYYDTVNKHLFLIPNLKYYFSGDSSDANMSGMNLDITGQFIGATASPGKSLEALTATIDDKYKFNAEPVAVNTTKMHMIVKPGFSRFSNYNNSALITGSDKYLEGVRHGPVQFASLGPASTLIAIGAKVPVFRVAPNSFNDSSIIFIGNVPAGDVLFPINF